MKLFSLVFAGLLALSTQAFAAEEVNIDIYLDGDKNQSISLVGPSASVIYMPGKFPNTTLEFRLIAPEPVILEVKEITRLTAEGDGDAAHPAPGVKPQIVEAVGRVKLVEKGSSFAVSDIKGAKFRIPYSLVRVN